MKSEGPDPIEVEKQKAALQAQLDVFRAGDQQDLERLKAVLQKEVDLERQRIQAHYDRWRHDNAMQLVMLRAVIDFALAGIRWAVVINGAAAIAVMTFVGHEKSSGSSRALGLLAWPLKMFLVGVFLGGVTAGLSYLAQYLFAQHNWMQKVGFVFWGLALLASAGSAAVFIMGAWSAADLVAR